MIVGTGDFKYEVVDSWPNMPRHWSFNSASDVSVNSDDEIYVFSRGLHPLTVWTKNGDFITSWGEGTFSNNEDVLVVEGDVVCDEVIIKTIFENGGNTVLGDSSRI